MSNSRALELREVSKSFGGVKALDRISASFAAGEVSALVGDNGAGKTTLFNLIGGFVKLDAGLISYKDKSLARLAPHRIARLGIGRLFQDSQVFQKMTVLENVAVAGTNGFIESPMAAALWPLASRTSEARNLEHAWKHLRFVELDDVAHRRAEQLSFGQQRRLAIARLLNNAADCLLLDEPTAGLTHEAASRILDLIRKIADAGRTIVMIEHNLDAVERISDRIFVLDRGRLASSETPVALKARAAREMLPCRSERTTQ